VVGSTWHDDKGFAIIDRHLTSLIDSSPGVIIAFIIASQSLTLTATIQMFPICCSLCCISVFVCPCLARNHWPEEDSKSLSFCSYTYLCFILLLTPYIPLHEQYPFITGEVVSQPAMCSDADTVVFRPNIGSSKIKYTGKAKVSALFNAKSRECLAHRLPQRMRSVSNAAEYVINHIIYSQCPHVSAEARQVKSRIHAKVLQ
jgi:hypothetical protein